MPDAQTQLILVPGVDGTLRVNGRARLRDEPALLESFRNKKRAPRLVIEVAVEDAYLQVERSVLPTMGQMLADQTGEAALAESQAQMVERYKADL